MNDRIKQLIKQCYKTGPIGKDGWPEYYTLDEEKFAKLLIQECLDQCYNRGMNDELYAGQLKAAAYIEEHFGVQ